MLCPICSTSAFASFRHPEKQVGCRLLVFDDDVTVALETAVGPAHQEHGRIVAIVRVAVAHAAAEVDQYLFGIRGCGIRGKQRENRRENERRETALFQRSTRAPIRRMRGPVIAGVSARTLSRT